MQKRFPALMQYYLKATPEEPKVERIPNHHKHVEKAIEKFHDALISEHEQSEYAAVDQGNLGVQVTVATNLLSAVITSVDDNEMKLRITHLKTLVEQGVITSIAMKLQRMARLMSKGKLLRDDAVASIYSMANRYEPYYQSDRERNKSDEAAPEIILSESFK